LNNINISGATASTYSAGNAGNYVCVVTNNCGSTISNSISVTVNSAPAASISASGSTTICSGNIVPLNANTGTGLTYQWKLNNINISGATSSSYLANSSGSYACFVTNSCGSTASNSIGITVNPVPTATIYSGTTTLCSGSNVSLVANLGSGVNYQWQLNGINI